MIDTLINFFTIQVPAGIVFVIQSRWAPIQELSPIMIGVLIQIALVVGVIFLVRMLRNTKVGITMTLLFDSMYEFFEEILGENEKRSIKIYIVTLFFVILIANML